MSNVGLSHIEAIDLVRRFHEHDSEHNFWMNNSELDQILGWDTGSTEMAVRESCRTNPGQYTGEQVWEGATEGIWTDYQIIRLIIKALDIAENQTLYDLGAGQGRVIMYAAIVTQALCRGIELVPERVTEANRVKEKLGVKNAEFIAANVLDVDFSNGDIFYMYVPFSTSTRDEVLRRINAIAHDKYIRVVTFLGSAEVKRQCPNLELIQKSPAAAVRIFRSRL